MTDRNKGEKKVTNIWNEEVYIKDPRYDHPSTDKTHHNYNPKHFQFFGPNKIALMEELQTNHQELVQLINSKHGTPPDWTMALLEVAAYCEVVVEGSYTEEDLEKLAGILKNKLMMGRLEFIFERPDLNTEEKDK